MSSKTTKSQTNKVSSESKKKSHKVLFIVLAVVAGAFLYWVLTNPGGIMGEQAKMEQYLEEKYGKEFVVENIRTEGHGIGMKGDLVGDAKPANSKFQFRIWGDLPGNFHDTYLASLWSNQQASEYNDYLSRLPIKPVKKYVDINLLPRVADDIKGIISLEEASKEYPEELTYGVKVVVDGNKPSDTDRKSLKKLIDYVNRKNSNMHAVRYVINSPTDDSRYYCQYYGGRFYKASENNNDNDLMSCFMHSEGKE